jgi:hypothetical protein
MAAAKLAPEERPVTANDGKDAPRALEASESHRCEREAAQPSWGAAGKATEE